MNQISCKYCQNQFSPSRTDMKFCKSKCRNDYNNKRTKYDSQLKEKQGKLKLFRAELQQAKETLENYQKDQQAKNEQGKNRENKEDVFRKAYKQLEQLTDEQLYQKISEEELKKETDSDERDYLKDQLRFCDEHIKQEIVSAYRAEKAAMLKEIKDREFSRSFDLGFMRIIIQTKSYEKQISELEEQITLFEQTEIKLELPTPSTNSITQIPVVKLSRKDKQARIEALNQKGNIREMDGSQIRNTNFNTYTLDGQLGEFLGHLDDNMIAIALTGNASAGKSYFSYQLAKLFLSSGKSARYYSLEEGIGNLTKEKLRLYDIGKEMVVVNRASLDVIDKAASKFDVIIIDSYSSISKDPEDYEILRQTHPKTIFIVIFQKTTANTIRGGSSITFNSSIIIDVRLEENGFGEERIATMKKSRYGTSRWEYSITRGFIISRG